MGSGRDELRGGGKRVYEAGAGAGKIETPCFFRADFGLDQASAGREKHIGRDGRNNDQIQLGRVQPAFFAQSFGGGSADVAGRLAFLNDTALADTRPFDDPFIRGIDDLFYILIGDAAFRQVVADRSYLRTTQAQQSSLSFESPNLSISRIGGEEKWPQKAKRKTQKNGMRSETFCEFCAFFGYTDPWHTIQKKQIQP